MKKIVQNQLWRLILLTASGLSLLSESGAQISVAPTTVVIEDRSPFGEFLVANRSNTVQEIVIDFQFGFPISNDAGETFMEYENVERGAAHDLGGRVRAFPRRFVLPAGEQQTVRLMVRPGSMPEGVYWTRIVTTSNPREEDVEAQQLRNDVSARIIFRIRQVTTVLFKQGAVSTGVKMTRIAARTEDQTVILDAEFEREGNAPFIGRSSIKIFDAQGEIVFEKEQNVSLYFDLLRRYSFPREEFSPGTYKAKIEFRAERRDIPSSELIAMEPVIHEAVFTIPPMNETERQTIGIPEDEGK